MPIFLGALIGALISALGTLVGKILISLGIGYLVFSGVDTSIAWAKAYTISHISAAGGNVVLVAGALRVGSCISILTSALTTRLIINGLTSGTMRKMVVK